MVQEALCQPLLYAVLRYLPSCGAYPTHLLLSRICRCPCQLNQLLLLLSLELGKLGCRRLTGTSLGQLLLLGPNAADVRQQ